MGCDIHMYVEYKDKGGSWRSGDYFQLDDPLCDFPKRRRIELYGDRNYALFAVLANVRNGGCDYIDLPRGLPDDATDYVKHEYERWRGDAHSCSYFTLRELIDFHDECRPLNDFGYDILEPVISRMKQRADSLELIWDFEWAETRCRNDARKKADNIRIVFWFDN